MKLLTRMMMLFLCISLVVTGCAKKEEKKAEPAKPAEGTVTKKETVVQVPDKIKGKWKAVTIALRDAKGGVQSYSIDIGSSLDLPGTDFSIKAINFFPHFIMEGINLTSKSNETKNPAVEIRIYRGGKEIHHGWVFANYPNTNIPKEFAFDIALTGATPAGQN